MQLGSPDAEASEEAFRLLLVADPRRKVKPLVAALEKTDQIEILLKILFILQGTRDRVAIAPLKRTCRYPNPVVRAAAVRALMYYESEECLESVSALLEDPSLEVRYAALKTLANYVGAGVLGAKELLIQYASDEGQPIEIRFAAIGFFKHFQYGEAREILKRFKEDEDARIYAAAIHCEEQMRLQRSRYYKKLIARSIQRLDSQDVGEIFEATQELKNIGGPAAPALVAIVGEGNELTGSFIWAKVALREMGGVAHGSILDRLRKVKGVRDYQQWVGIMALLDILSDFPTQRMEKPLIHLLRRLQRWQEKEIAFQRKGMLNILRARIHAILAEIGSDRGLPDLMKLLEAGSPDEWDPLDSLEKIGGHKALLPLINLYLAEKERRNFARMRKIKSVFGKIVKREGIHLQSRRLNPLRLRRRAALKELLSG